MRFYDAQPVHDLTYADVFLVPSRSDVGSRFNVDLTPRDSTGATIPVVAANMNSVTGPRLAATIARRGGLGILPQDLHIDAAQEAIQTLKHHPLNWVAPFRVAADSTVSEVRGELPPADEFGISVAGDDGEILGVLPATILTTALPDARVGDLLHAALPTISSEVARSGEAAFTELYDRGIHVASVVDSQGKIVGTLSQTQAMRSTVYTPALGRDGRLLAGVAIGINGDVQAKAQAFMDVGADVLVVDTAHGHQGSMLRAVERVAEIADGRPVVAGNVVSASGARDLIHAGASIVKVGVGPGAMCTTRMMTAVGRPQFSAVLETSDTAQNLGAAVWADGGVRYPRDVALALAAGAASVMIGSWLAGTIEAPGVVNRDTDGRMFKENYGMASQKAVTQRFTALSPLQRARKALFAEGISTSKLYLDPRRPSLENILDDITTGVRSSCTYAGAKSLQEFHDRALVGIQSAAGYEEGRALPESW